MDMWYRQGKKYEGNYIIYFELLFKNRCFKNEP